MRKILLSLLLLMTAFSGCLSDDEGSEGDGGASTADSDGDGFTDEQEAASGSDPADATSKPTVPDAEHYEGNLRGIGDGFATGASTGCSLQQSEANVEQDPGCAVHEVTVPAPGWAVTFLLSPGTGTVSSSPDYDLFIFNEAGDEVGSSTNPGGEDDRVSKRLGAGTYSVMVMAWDNMDAPYTLDVSFAF